MEGVMSVNIFWLLSAEYLWLFYFSSVLEAIEFSRRVEDGWGHGEKRGYLLQVFLFTFGVKIRVGIGQFSQSVWIDGGAKEMFHY